MNFGYSPLALISVILVLLSLSSCETNPNSEALSSKVNPLIGTGGHGHTYPGATTPFGMVQLSPDTRLSGWDGCGGYHFSDTLVYGFSHTHLQGTGVSDYGDILFMPTGGQKEFVNRIGSAGSEGYCSFFKKSSEQASAGYYTVFLEDVDTQVELTATPRCGIQRYQFREQGKQFVSIDLEHRDPLLEWHFEQIDDYHVQGYRVSKEWAQEQHVYFYSSFSSPILGIYQKNEDDGNLNAQGLPIFSLEFNPGEELIVKTAISAVDNEGAKLNYTAEMDEKASFQKLITKASELWDNELNGIEIEGGSKDEQVVFYTSLYHSYTVPNLFSDADGRYRGTDLKIHRGSENSRYTVFSLWDTYRATHPLFTITQRARTLDFIHSFLGQYQEGGKLPMWELAGNYTGCMIGYHAVPVIVDAYMKGIRDFDQNMALEAMLSTAHADELGKSVYAELGYIPMDAEHESVSKALEYAYNDWCIAVYADSLGRKEVADEFYRRAQSYKNHFDPESGFMRARFNGGFMDPFDPAEVNFNYTEANSWQYSFYVPQDIEGLIELYGSTGALNAKLDELFSASTEVSGREQPDITGLIGQYAHGNEPSHHMSYLYNYTGNPARSQELAQQIMRELYFNAPDGLSGNEDCGQMSSWYVLSAMGLYPVCPGSDEYVLSMPIFDKTKIDVADDKYFTISRKSVGQGTQYIKSARLNGKTLNRLYLHHSELASGGKLEIECTEDPDMAFKPTPENRPHSRIPSPMIQPAVIIDAPGLSFKDSMELTLLSADPELKLWYRVNQGAESIYSQAFMIYDDVEIEAWSSDDSGVRSNSSTGRFIKRKNDRKLALLSTYSNQYTGGGADALIDGLRGGTDFRTGFWQGYYGVDPSMIVDLGKVEDISYLGAGFLEDIKPWIWFPKQLSFSSSNDGINFEKVLSISNDGGVDDYSIKTKEFGSPVKLKARYIKVEVNGFGEIPDWHLGAGNPSWVFMDEIIIR